MTQKIVIQETWESKTRPNPTAKIPYGYQANKDDPLLLEPIQEVVEKVSIALSYIDNGNSLRETARWLSEESGCSISHQGLSNIWKRFRGDTKNNPRAKKLSDRKKKNSPKTKKEKEAYQLRQKRAAGKRSVTVTEKKLKEFSKATKDVAPNGLGGFESIETLPKNKEILFKPNPGPQTEFLAANEREVLYGGSAGGGKTYSLIADPMRYFHNKNFNGLILRRTNDELREMIWKTQELYPRAFPGAKWGEKKSQWTFPSGSRLWLTYLERDEDCLRYQGQAFSYIGFDELTQHPTPFAWNYMRSRLRTTDPDLPIFMRATTNPGGPGHSWVREMFIKPAPENRSFPATDIDTGEVLAYPKGHEKEGKILFNRKFIPAKLKDNPYLVQGGAYEANLLSLPEMQRRQLLEGDWSVAEGAAFSEFKNSIHVVDPFEIPHDWTRFRSCDFGYSSFSAVHWYAIDPAYENLVVYRELYVSKHTARDLARRILGIEIEAKEQIAYGVLDSSCWHNRGQFGPSIAEEMMNEGVRWRPSDRTAGSRIAGKNRLHELLKVDEITDMPGICFFETCRQVISDLPVIPSDPKGTDDIDKRYASDHTYDSIRYGIQTRPRTISLFDREKPEYKWRPADTTFGY
jgi:hypothetical protein